MYYYEYNSSVIEIHDIDYVFMQTNNAIKDFLLDHNLSISFDFSDKNNRVLYTHFFLQSICEFIKIKSPYNKIIFYNNALNKDNFRNNLIKKIVKIFGIKIFSGIWDIKQFMSLVVNKDSLVYDKFETLINCNCKPKSFKHIKKYLIAEGLVQLQDSYFQDVANKMIIVC